MKPIMHLGRGTQVGPVTFFPIWTEDPVPDHDYVPYPQVQDRVTVQEAPTASVPVLQIANSLDRPVLLLAGQTLAGGLQDRVLNTSVLLPAAAKAELPVTCVERGRWNQRRGEAPRTGMAHPKLRAKKVEAVSRSRSTRGDWAADQAGVWSEVEDVARRTRSRSATANFNEVREVALQDLRSARRPRQLPGQRGLLIGLGGRPAMLELFDHEATLHSHWDAIVDGALVDGAGHPAEPTFSRRAQRFIARLDAARVQHAPSVCDGQDVRLRGDRLHGAGLSWCGRTVHLVAFAEVN